MIMLCLFSIFSNEAGLGTLYIYFGRQRRRNADKNDIHLYVCWFSLFSCTFVHVLPPKMLPCLYTH